MPINYNILQPLQSNTSITPLPGAQDQQQDSGIGGLLGGLSSFASALHSPSKGIDLNSPNNPAQGYVQNAITGQGQPNTSESRLSQLVSGSQLNQTDPMLKGVNSELSPKVQMFINDMKQQGFQPVIKSGARTVAEQAEKVRLGYSHTMNSQHIGGNAVDIVDQRYGWDDKKYPNEIKGYADAAAKTAKKYGLFSGTEWKSFGPNGDFAHLGLPNPMVSQPKKQQTVNSNPLMADLPHVMAGIAHVETGGSANPYIEVGKPTKTGDRAYGKYQIMGSNIPSWTHEALGYPMTPTQFLNSPEAQEAVVKYHVNKHLKAGYSPEDTANIWFTGKPVNKSGNPSDTNGTTADQYRKAFNKGYLQSKEGLSGPTSPMAMNSRAIPPLPSIPQPGVVPNIRAFNRNTPIRDLSPQEIDVIMRNLPGHIG